VKKAHSYPPGREERLRGGSADLLANPADRTADDDEPAVLPLSRSGAWVGWLLAALAVALLAFGAWKLMGAPRTSAPAAPAHVADAPPVTPVTPNEATTTDAARD
jgi:hypothetical protein